MSDFWYRHLRKIVLGLLILGLFIGFKVLKYQGPQEPEKAVLAPAKEVAIVEREAQLVAFGDWSPTEYRSVLGQVQSDSDVGVKAELSGTIARVNVKVGTKVYTGQVLAGYKTLGDPTAINYQSAVSNLQTAKLSAENSVRSAEIAVENARKALQQTTAQQDQNYQQVYQNLRAEEPSADTLINNAIDTIDKYVQFTPKYKYNQSIAYTQIGNTDVIRKQQVKTAGQQASQKALALTRSLVSASESQILANANTRLALLRELQSTYQSLEVLIERTAINTRISEAEIQNFLAQVEGVHNALNGKVSAYVNQIEGAKGAREGTRLATLNAQNGVESALANLELAKSQAEAQVIGAQNQVNIAGASTADLVVRAPISGTITSKSVNVGDLVGPGQELFTIVNEQQQKKVVAYLNQDEWSQAQRAEQIEIEIDGQTITAEDLFLSPQLNTQTQKVLAEFTIPAGTTLVGNLATVKIPLGTTLPTADMASNLIPFSAVSFEPDGPEVLVINAQNIAERRKVTVDRVVVSNIEIVAGLKPGEQVVEYYKRVLPGEKVLNEALPQEPSAAIEVTSEDVVEATAELELNLEADNE